MTMRTMLLSGMQELTLGNSQAVSIGRLEKILISEHVTSADFAIAVQAALNDGDLKTALPGQIAMTATGKRHYLNILQAK